MLRETTIQGDQSTGDENQSMLLFHKSLNSISDGYLLMNEQLDYLFVNVAGAKMLDQTPEGMIGRNFTACHNNSGFKNTESIFREAITGKKNMSGFFSPIPGKPAVNIQVSYNGSGITVLLKPGKETVAGSEVAEPENLSRTILEGLRDGIMAADIETREIILANKSMSNLLGYKPEELRKMAIEQLHPESELPKIIKEIELAISGKSTPGLNLRFLHKNKSIVLLDVYQFKMRIDGRDCFCGVFKDAAERNAVESSIKAANEVRKIAEIGYWEFDLVNDKLYWSDETFILFGLKPGEFVPTSKNFVEFVHPDDRKRLNETFDEHLSTRKPYSIIYRVITPNRKLITVNERCHTQYDLEGKPIRSMGVVADISYLKAAEENAYDSAMQYRMIFEVSPIGMIAVNDRGTVLNVNSKFTEITGYKLHQVPNVQRWWEIAYPDEAYRFKTRLRAKKSLLNLQRHRGKFQPFESAVRCLNGETRYFEIGLATGSSIHMITFVDITSHKLARQKLLEQEERLNQLAIQSKTFAWEVDNNGLYTYLNDVVESVLGYSAGEIIGKKHFYDFHPEDSREEFKKEALAVFQTKAIFNDLHNQALSQKGDLLWLSTNGIPLLNKDGSLRGYRGSDTDISEKKYAEIALKKSEENFRRIADNINEIFWLRDANNQKMIYINPAYEKIFGRTRQSLYTNPDSFLEAIHPEDRDRMMELFMIYLETSEFNTAYRIVRPDGDIRWLQAKTMPVRNEQGEITGHTGFAVDITSKMRQDEILKKNANEIEESNSLLNTLLNNLPDLIWLKDTAGNYIRCNKRFESFIGKPNEEIIGASDYALFEPELAEFFRIHDKAAMEAGAPLMNEEQIKFADGHNEILETTKSPMKDASGNVLGVLGIGHNITVRKTAENNLRMERDLFSDGPVFTISWDSTPNWPVKYVSANVEKILGYTPEELTSPDFRYISIIHPEDLPAIAEQARYNLHNHINAFEQSYRLRLKNGEYRWFYDFTKVVRDDAGKVTLIRGYLFDQTRKKELETELLGKNKQLNLIVQNIPGAVFSSTGLDQRNFDFVSAFIETITGYSPADFEKDNTLYINNLIHHDDARRLKRVMKKAYIKGENYSLTYRIRHKNGTYRWVYETGEFQEFGLKAEEVKADGVLFDMTEKITAEEEKLNTVFQAADNERTRIAGEIHDGLQQTMVAGKINFEMLKNEMGLLSPTLQERYNNGLQYLEQAVQEARNISHSLMPKQINEFGFIVAVDNLISNLDKGIEFRFFHDNIQLNNDKITLNLYRIIQEALTNIIKHAGAKKVHINLTVNEELLHLTIEDDGHGFRMDEAAGPHKGIGLQSMKSRAATIGANLEMYSEPGQGTLIVIDLEMK